MFRAAAVICWAALNCAAILPPALIERGEDNLTFDEASKIEILSFAKIVLNRPPLTIDMLAQKTDLKATRINFESVKRIRARILNDLLANYYAASGVNGKEISRENAEAKLRDLTRSFAVDFKRERFYESYFYEMIRLAALFPKTSSEIDRFSDAEILGSELNDREFFLTFDDGPSDQNHTERLITFLNSRDINAIFFALGSAAQKRESVLADLYEKQCLANHGWAHISHTKNRSEAINSIFKSADLLRGSAPNSYIPVFRPPYGQRSTDSAMFFADSNITFVLWNIDSQDWQEAVSAKAAADRVLTLMLVWRKGVILFHDTNNKAHTAVEIVYSRAKKWNISFMNCRLII
jgi:peptidoglycan/xylan/chitin deacetylase (PgdA/CDA1 family)